MKSFLPSHPLSLFSVFPLPVLLIPRPVLTSPLPLLSLLSCFCAESLPIHPSIPIQFIPSSACACVQSVIGDGSIKTHRQELFSFAAAGIAANTVEERCAVLASQSTRAKLEWAEAAIEPYLQKVKAERAMNNAIGKA